MIGFQNNVINECFVVSCDGFAMWVLFDKLYLYFLRVDLGV